MSGTEETIGICVILAFATLPPLVDYLLVSRAGELERFTFFGDREFRHLLLSMIGAGVLAAVVGTYVPALGWPGNGWGWIAIGVVVMCLGNGLRYWAILTLGRFFRFVVEVQDGHRVITTGPYRFIRHPSYTGLLLMQLGLGIAISNTLSLLICLTLPLLPLVNRIRSEELALSKDLGSEYVEYMTTTKRLIPRVW
ncbi:MAG TPA: isoprenylcysteine carboxylmethyltransferase family protein [Solirubrobacterales bacterium]